MNRNRVRALLLLASTTAAMGVFVAAAQLRAAGKRDVLRIQVHAAPTSIAMIRKPSVQGIETTLDPKDPREWRFYLDPDQAEAFFSLKANANRVVYDPWCYERDLGNFVFEFKWPEHPNGKWTWKSNSLGCREDHELDDPPRDVRVLVAGDSHACGVCNDEESFANLLEAKLAAERPKKTVEVLNAALGGYGPFNYLGTLLRFRDFHPKVIVVGFFAGNDFQDVLPLYWHFTRSQWPSPSSDEIKRRMRGMRVSKDVMGQGFTSIDDFRNWPKTKGVAERATLLLFREMKRVAEKNGAKLVVVFIPNPFDLVWRDPPPLIEATRKELGLSDEDLDISRHMSEAFLDDLKRDGFALVDMRAAYAREPDPPYWRADYHINLRGHQLIAQELQPVVDAALAEQ
jgi:hypothetical protein